MQSIAILFLFFHTISVSILAYTVIDNTTWFDDFDTTSSGWDVPSTFSVTSPIFTTSASTGTKYHGAYSGPSSRNRGDIWLTRSFYCEQASNVYLWYTFAGCGFESPDYVAALLNDIEKARTNPDDSRDSLSDSAISQVDCNSGKGKNWGQIAYGPLVDKTETDDSFTVSFQFNIDHNSDVFFLSDIHLECHPIPPTTSPTKDPTMSPISVIERYTLISMDSPWSDDGVTSGTHGWSVSPNSPIITIPSTGYGQGDVFHGPYRNNLYTISRDFVCNHTASVHVTFVTARCTTDAMESSDYADLYLNNVKQTQSSFTGVTPEDGGFEQNALQAGTCPSWNEEWETFHVQNANLNGISLVPYHTPFNVEFRLKTSSTNEWWTIQGITVTCASNPTNDPTISPTLPTQGPTKTPTQMTQTPSQPSQLPTKFPSNNPTIPTTFPTRFPSVTPTGFPTTLPSITPTELPSVPPTIFPTKFPSITPTKFPSKFPSITPTALPSSTPTKGPTGYPTMTPSQTPSQVPSISPTKSPTRVPTLYPSNNPTASPSDYPTLMPSVGPTPSPTRQQDAGVDDNEWTTTEDPHHDESKEEDQNSNDMLGDLGQSNLVFAAASVGVFLIGVIGICIFCRVRRNKSMAKEIAFTMSQSLENDNETVKKRPKQSYTQSDAANTVNSRPSTGGAPTVTGTMTQTQTGTGSYGANNAFAMPQVDAAQVWSMSMASSMAAASMAAMSMSQQGNAAFGATLEDLGVANGMLMGDVIHDMQAKSARVNPLTGQEDDYDDDSEVLRGQTTAGFGEEQEEQEYVHEGTDTEGDESNMNDDDDNILEQMGMGTQGGPTIGSGDTPTPPAPPPPGSMSVNPVCFVAAAEMDEVISDEDDFIIRGDNTTGQ
eukprot:274465_1